MSDKPQWTNAPAFGVVLAKLVSIYTRALRVDMEQRRQALERMAKMTRPVK